MQNCIVNVYYYLVGENFSWHLHHKKFFINCDPLPIIRHMPNENLTNIDEDFFSLNVINISACLEKINWNLYIRIMKKDNKFNCIIKMSNEINISMCFYISVANGDVYDLIHVNA